MFSLLAYSFDNCAPDIEQRLTYLRSSCKEHKTGDRIWKCTAQSINIRDSVQLFLRLHHAAMPMCSGRTGLKVCS